MKYRSIYQALLAAAVLSFLLSSGGHCQEDEEEKSGLVGVYTDGAGNRAERRDLAISFVWDREAPDERLRPGKFEATWTGYLLTQKPGDYTLHARVQGRLRISIGEKTILDQQSDGIQLVSAKPQDMPFGWHPIEIKYSKTDDEGQLSLFWQGPNFGVEPLSRLSHDIDDSPAPLYERGQQLARALRCEACHTEGPASTPPSADLTNLRGNLHRSWLIEWLTEPHASPPDDESQEADSMIARRMPHFALTKQDAEDLTDYLLGKVEEKATKAAKGKKAEGEELLLTLGCLACHRLDGLGKGGLFGGGELSKVWSKRPASFFRKWLTQPEKLNANHRMPVFELTSKEVDNLGSYLATLGSPGAAEESGDAISTPSAERLTRGKKLLADHHCLACHTKKGEAPLNPSAKPFTDKSNWTKACFNPPADSRPGYSLSQSDRQALQHYFQSRNATSQPAGSSDLLLAENNCLSCHARGEWEGIRPVATRVVSKHGKLAPLLPAMSPPALDSVGDKLYESALKAAIERKHPARRSWLKVRMPKFRFQEQELDQLARYFVQRDRVPTELAKESTPPSSTAMKVAGAQLVTTNGFGCTSCHQVGKSIPPKAPLNARGPDLSLLGETDQTHLVRTVCS